MSKYYRHLIEDGLLLDTYPNAAVAYSLRKLRTSYTGSAIRVRRSWDNAEQDFGFDNSGDLDVNSIENFVGYNLFAWSEQLQQPYWAKNNLTVTTDSLVAPDGNTTGDVLFETTTSGTHVMGRTLAVIAGNEYTVSFWIKGQGRDNVRIVTAVNLSWDGVTIPTAWLNLATGTIVSQNAGFDGTVQISPAPNGWYFVTYRVKTVTNATSQMTQLNLSPDGLTISYVGDVTKGIAVWGLQVTESSTLKPYRQTLAIAEGQGFVTTWYDQSGNDINATQSTVSLQATIVSNGNTIFVNNKVAAQFTNDFYNLSAGVTPASQFITANVIERPSGGRFATWGNRSSNQRPHLFSWNTDNNINCSPYSLGNFRTITNSSYGGQSIVTTKRITGNVIQGSLNGVQYTPMSTQSNQSAVGFLGGVNSSEASSGYLQETIWWNQNYSSLELNISDKINEYYGIY